MENEKSSLCISHWEEGSIPKINNMKEQNKFLPKSYTKKNLTKKKKKNQRNIREKG